MRKDLIPMKKFMKKLAKKAEGFTLVELIVVIAILGILAAVAVPAYTGYIEKADQAADETTLSGYATAISSACALHSVDPADITVTVTNNGDSSTITINNATVASEAATFMGTTYGTGLSVSLKSDLDFEWNAGVFEIDS